MAFSVVRFRLGSGPGSHTEFNVKNLIFSYIYIDLSSFFFDVYAVIPLVFIICYLSMLLGYAVVLIITH